MALRVLLVDDHHLFRAGLRGLLEEEGFEVDDAESGAAAVERARAQPPDVVVMDMHMPGLSGVEATPRVLAVAPSARVLMLTVASDDAAVLDAVRAGASGYLLKDAELDAISGAIRIAAAGGSVLAPRVASGVLATVRERPAEAPDARLVAGLTDRERDVLRLLTEGAENAEIAARLYLSQSTVKTYLSSIFEKLGVQNRVQAAVLAIRLGLDGPAGSE